MSDVTALARPPARCDLILQKGPAADLKVTFPAASGKCWTAIDMLGAPLSGAAAKVCTDATGSLTVTRLHPHIATHNVLRRD
jgi:hypothetical protein